jgi:prophage regulatory protein
MKRLLTKREAAKLVSMDPATLMRLAKAGKFPQPIKLGDSANCHVRFDLDELAAWIEECCAAREVS